MRCPLAMTAAIFSAVAWSTVRCPTTAAGACSQRPMQGAPITRTPAPHVAVAAAGWQRQRWLVRVVDGQLAGLVFGLVGLVRVADGRQLLERPELERQPRLLERSEPGRRQPQRHALAATARRAGRSAV